jgi:hypothetical protein
MTIFPFLAQGNYVLLNRILFLGSFVKLRKKIISFVTSVCPSVSMEQLDSHWTDFYEIYDVSIFRKSFTKIQVSLKPDKNNEYFT